MAEIEDCACGKDHEVMPMDFDFTCSCIMESWLPEDEWLIQDGCEHPITWFELVCRTHNRHIPCRLCLYGGEY